MQSKLQELERKASSMEKENLKMKETEGRIRKIIEENQFMKMQMESLNRQLDRKIKELGESDFQLKLAKAENQTLKKEIGELDDKYRDNMKEFRTMEEKIQTQHTQVMKLQALSEEQHEQLLEHESRVLSLQDQLEEAQEGQKELERALDAKDKELVAREHQLQSTREKLNELEVVNFTLSKMTEGQLAKEKDLQGKLRRLSEDFAAKMAEWKRKEETLHEEVASQKLQNQKLGADLEDTRERFDSYMVASAESQQELKEEVDHLKNKISDLNDETYALSK